MATGTIEYASTIAGVRFAPLEVSSAHPRVEKIVLQTQDSKRLKITFHLTDVIALEDARTISEGVLPSLINRLAFHRNVPVGEPYFVGASLPKETSGSSHRVVTDALLLSDSVAPVLTLSDEDARQELTTLLEQPCKHQDLYAAYRFAGHQSDPITRFMFLYNILLQLNKDRQKEVDDFIRQEMPSVSQSPSPHHAGVMETIYTRLRNEVGHGRAGTTPEETRKEMQDNLPAFQTLVRTAISHVIYGGST
jgi:hypothetical protein